MNIEPPLKYHACHCSTDNAVVKEWLVTEAL